MQTELFHRLRTEQEPLYVQTERNLFSKALCSNKPRTLDEVQNGVMLIYCNVPVLGTFLFDLNLVTHFVF